MKRLVLLIAAAGIVSTLLQGCAIVPLRPAYVGGGGYYGGGGGYYHHHGY